LLARRGLGDGAEQLGTLQHSGEHEPPAIAGAEDTEALGARYSVVDAPEPVVPARSLMFRRCTQPVTATRLLVSPETTVRDRPNRLSLIMQRRCLKRRTLCLAFLTS
jgi:hypothetical protein